MTFYRTLLFRYEFLSFLFFKNYSIDTWLCRTQYKIVSKNIVLKSLITLLIENYWILNHSKISISWSMVPRWFETCFKWISVVSSFIDFTLYFLLLDLTYSSRFYLFVCFFCLNYLLFYFYIYLSTIRQQK